jgi:glycosyltransferase involved in cell wall biosynthesis
MTPRDLPLVTALVTFHNQARFVRPALDSVLGQSYPRLETVVVDDGSTDGTAAECARYGDRIRVISRENGGVALARNTGLQAARGNYIAHLDGDDVWHPEKIARQVDAALRHPGAGMVIADGHVFREDHPDEHGLIWGEAARRMANAPDEALSLSLYETLIRRHCFATPSQILVPAAVYRAVGEWDARLRIVADCEIALRVARRYPIVLLRGDLVGYRYLPSSMSGPAAGRMLVWGLEEFRMLRLHGRTADSWTRPIMAERARQRAAECAREAYYRGRRGEWGWGVRYLGRLLVESRRVPEVLPFLVALLLPARLVGGVLRVRRGRSVPRLPRRV